jgi:DNA-binding CsgD family transcriptional regulator/Tfp pilus assembly protein PilF
LSGDLWERDEELAAADRHIARAVEGHGGALFILGEAGLGKTTLLEEISRRARDEGLVVAGARCDPMETSLAFELLSQIVHGLGGTHEQWSVAYEQTDARAATFYRALHWVRDAVRGPVLVTVDDLQWADPDSLAFLGFLCRRLAGLPVAVIASLRGRPPAAADLARGLVNRGEAVLQRLAPLTEAAAAGVLAQREGAPLQADLARQAWQASGGNPLLLGLAASSLVEGSGSTRSDGLAVSMDERSLVLGRFSGLSAVETSWAQAATVLGIGFRPELVGEVAGMDAGTGELAAEGVWRTGLARSITEGAGEFVHPLYAQLLYDDISPLVRTRLHARAFTALTARGMDDSAAEHALRANLTGDARAIDVLTEAGRRAARAGAPATAANRLEAAVRLSGDATPATLLAELGEALLEAGRLEEAAATLTSVLRTELAPTTRVKALTTLSQAHFSMGDFARAGTALETATALAQHENREAVVLPLCHHATAVLMTAGPASALPIAARALELAQGCDPGLQAQTRATWGLLSFFCGDVAGLVAAETEGRPLLGMNKAQLAEDLRSGATGVLTAFAGAAGLAGRFDEAEAAFRMGIDAAEQIGAVHTEAGLRIGYGLMLMRTRVGDCLVVADQLLAVTDLVPLVEPFARTMRSYALLEMGQEQDSIAEQERAQATAVAFGLWQSLLLLEHVQGLRLLRGGRHKDASEVYAGLEDRERHLGLAEPCTVPYARHAVVAHIRSGRIDEAEHFLARLEERAGRLPCAWPQAAAAASRALLALHHGQHAEAESQYRIAVSILDGASLPLELAEVLVDHGTMLRHHGRPREARESFRRAVELAESVGATWLARRSSEELAAAGGRRRARRGATELTPQEQRIARLAATGASDKDIATHFAVSVRTVRSHLEHIYMKLDIHSRRELMNSEERPEAGTTH